MIRQINLSDEQLMIIHEGLMLVAFGKAAPVIDAISRQLNKLPTEEQLEASHRRDYQLNGGANVNPGN